jgi:hypothetical protein
VAELGVTHSATRQAVILSGRSGGACALAIFGGDDCVWAVFGCGALVWAVRVEGEHLESLLFGRVLAPDLRKHGWGVAAQGGREAATVAAWGQLDSVQQLGGEKTWDGERAGENDGQGCSSS